VGVNRPGAFAELIAPPHDQHLAAQSNVNQEVVAIFDPFGNAAIPRFPGAGRRRVDHRAGPIGVMAILGGTLARGMAATT
jgi:threonine 3-dehydrogenase